MENNLNENEKNAIKNYPTAYNNTSGAFQVKNEDTKRLIESAIKVLDENQDLDNTHVSTGNTIVFATRMHIEDGGGIHIVVSKNYEEIYIDNEILS